MKTRPPADPHSTCKVIPILIDGVQTNVVVGDVFKIRKQMIICSDFKLNSKLSAIFPEERLTDD